VCAVFVDGAGTVALSERVREFLAGLERLVVDLPSGVAHQQRRAVPARAVADQLHGFGLGPGANRRSALRIQHLERADRSFGGRRGRPIRDGSYYRAMSLEGTLETAGGDAGDAVLFVFTVANAGDETVELEFMDACTAEFVLVADGEEVWRFTDGRAFAQVLSSDTLAPGESVTYEAEWTDPQPGVYTAIAELRATDETCEARTDVSVPP